MRANLGGSIGTSGLSVAPPVKAGEHETGKALWAIGATVAIAIADPTHQTQDIGTIRRVTAIKRSAREYHRDQRSVTALIGRTYDCTDLRSLHAKNNMLTGHSTI